MRSILYALDLVYVRYHSLGVPPCSVFTLTERTTASNLETPGPFLGAFIDTDHVESFIAVKHCLDSVELHTDSVMKKSFGRRAHRQGQGGMSRGFEALSLERLFETPF